MKKPRSWLILVATVICSVSFSSLYSQEYPVYEARISVMPNNVTVGDLIEINIEISHKKNIIFTITEPILPSGMDLTISEDQVSIFEKNNTDLISSRTFKIASYTLALQERGYIDLLWVDSKLMTGEVRIELPQIDISPTRTKDDWSLRPFLPLFDEENLYSFNYQQSLMICGFAFLIIYLFISIWKRTKRESDSSKQYDEDIAKNHLGLLRGMSFDSLQKYRDFYQSIDGIIRQYIRLRYGIQASSLTVKELIVQAELFQVDNWQLRLIRDLLNRCDEVIYGNILPDPILADRDLTIAFEIIELNRESILDEITIRDTKHEI